MMKLDPKVKAKWVKALRSGKYKQTKYQLRHPDEGYCCLGVLCETAGATWEDESYAYIDGEQVSECGLLFQSFRKKLGLSKKAQSALIKKNDGLRGKTFPEIADYIEERL